MTTDQARKFAESWLAGNLEGLAPEAAADQLAGSVLALCVENQRLVEALEKASGKE